MTKLELCYSKRNVQCTAAIINSIHGTHLFHVGTVWERPTPWNVRAHAHMSAKHKCAMYGHSKLLDTQWRFVRTVFWQCTTVTKLMFQGGKYFFPELKINTDRTHLFIWIERYIIQQRLKQRKHRAYIWMIEESTAANCLLYSHMQRSGYIWQRAIFQTLKDRSKLQV